MKHIAIIILLINIVLCFSIPLKAENTDSSMDIQNKIIEDSTKSNAEIKSYIDKEETLELLKHDLEFIQHTTDIKKLDISTAIKVYYPIINFDKEKLVTETSKGNFDTLISDRYVWIFPIYDRKGQYINTCKIKTGEPLEEIKNRKGKQDVSLYEQYKAIEGKLVISEINTGMSKETAEILSSPERISEIITSSDITNVEYIKIVAFSDTYIVYVKANGEEFGFPFSYDYNLNQGQKYTMKQLASLITGQSANEATNIGAGNYVKKITPENNNIQIISILLVVSSVLLVSLVIIYFIKKKNNSKFKN